MIMEKIILCIGDSLGMPRKQVEYVKTWRYLLKEEYPQYDFVHALRRFGTTSCLHSPDALEFYNPDVVIIHLGICDCAPRYIHRIIEMRIIPSLSPRVQKIFWKIRKSTHKRSIKHAWVSIKQFRNNLINYLDRCKLSSKCKKVIFVKIVQPMGQIINRNPDIITYITNYNQVFDEMVISYPFVTIVEQIKGEDNFIAEDGYHFNETGNQALFNYLKTLLK
jgi:lysophospholipase L1-like esterase